jgi:hypothetical protein
MEKKEPLQVKELERLAKLHAERVHKEGDRSAEILRLKSEIDLLQTGAAALLCCASPPTPAHSLSFSPIPSE